MPFYELHPLSYTILCYTKGDLFSMLYGSFSILYGSFLNIQTLSPKVSLVIIRKEKRQQALQQKIKCLDLFSVSFFILFQNYALFQEAETGLFFQKISSYKNSHQTNMHLIMHIWQQGLKVATGWVIYVWQQSATSFWRNYTKSSVIGRIKNPHCAQLCLMVWCLDIKVQAFDSYGGN